MAVLFASAAGIAAALLFLCQPLLVKLSLPAFGGSPSVWATASFLFQGLLLVGYVYVDRATRWLGRRQIPVHVLVVLLPLVVLPLALPVDAAPGDGTEPVWWLVRTLFLAVGLPFLALAATGPLLQAWYAWSGRPGADDPYALYAASNVGSLAGLLLYPFVIEWSLSLSGQRWLWTGGYVLFVGLLLVAALVTWRSTRVGTPGLGAVSADAAVGPVQAEPGQGRGVAAGEDDPVDWRRRARWLWWSFLPAATSLAVTTHLSTDVAALPLLWVAPLSLYLVTFIVAFSRKGRSQPRVAAAAAVALALAALVAYRFGVVPPLPVAVGVGLLLVLLVGLAGHGRLAADRPAVTHLTSFYVILSVGGLLGAVANGLMAPLLLSGPYEYPFLLALVPLLLVGLRGPRPVPRQLKSFGVVGWVAEVVLVLALVLGVGLLASAPTWALLLAATAGLVVVVAGALGRLAAPVLVILGLVAALGAFDSSAVLRDRTFFGSYRVLAGDPAHVLLHGTTLHGVQLWPDGQPSLDPTTYYARTGPLGDLLGPVPGDSPFDLGVVGLGTGTIVGYAGPSWAVDVFEIDPVILDIASRPELFTFLDATPATVAVEIGDGRLLVGERPPASFDALIVDAFSSDAIPLHLMTVEAVDLYLDRVRADGWVALHVSNRHLELVPVVGAIAEAVGAEGWVRRDVDTDESVAEAQSIWIVLGRGEALSSPGPEWTPLTSDGRRAWTDDYSSVLAALK